MHKNISVLDLPKEPIPLTNDGVDPSPYILDVNPIYVSKEEMKKLFPDNK